MRRAPILAAAAGLAISACAPPAERPVDPDDLPLRGTKPLAPMEKVDFTLTDTEGRPFDFRDRTDGSLTLLFFGYTYCPDVCPLHMATLASALAELDAEVRQAVRVVFVTVDPERDTPERLAQWLDAFDSTFVGLRGSPEEIAEILAFYRYPPPERGPEETGYLVGHPALVYAFTPDDLGRAMYGAETTQATWVHDLALMAGHPWTGSGDAAAAQGPSPGVLGSVGPILVMDAYAPVPAAGSTTALYVTLLNTGGAPDTLVAVESEAAAGGMLHATVTEDGIIRMVPMAGGLELLPGVAARLEPGGGHGMLTGLTEELVAGRTLPVTLVMARAGRVTVAARIVRYADLPR